MEQIAFFFGAIGALGGAIAVVSLKNPFYSVLALVVHLVFLAGIFLLLMAQFLAAALIVVYAGAVMVLYVFVAAYVGGIEEPKWDSSPELFDPAAARRSRGDRARRPAPRGSEQAAEGRGELMNIEWFLVLSALLFTVGLIGVLIRRNPVVILLCLELMLSAGALALLAFSRMLGNQDGQVFVLIVLVVAACEVVVGLGLVVAMYRRRLPLDVDEMKELKG